MSVLNRIFVQAVLSCNILPITELSRACLGYIFHLLPSVLRAAPASMGMTSRGKIPLRPTATEPTRDRNQTWACSLAKNAATVWRPGRSSVRLGPGPAALAVAWAIDVCAIFWLLDAPLRVSISRVTGINRAARAQLGFQQLPPFIRPTVQKALATSNAATEEHILRQTGPWCTFSTFHFYVGNKH